MGNRKKRFKRRREVPADPREADPAATSRAEMDHSEPAPDRSMTVAGIEFAQYGRFLLQRNIRSEEEHKRFMEEMAESRKTLPELIEAEAHEIESLLSRRNSFEILSQLAFSQLTIDPETYQEWSHEGRAAFVEYAALLCLKGSFREGAEDELIDGKVITDLIERIRNVFDRTLWYYGTESADSSNGINSELRYLSITNSMMVRNQSYPHHLKELLVGLFSDLDPWLFTTLGFHLEDLFAVAEIIQTLGMDRLYHLKKEALTLESDLTDAVMKARQGIQPRSPDLEPLIAGLLASRPEETASRISNIGIATMFMSLGTTFSYTADELSESTRIPTERVEAVLRSFSIGFGEVEANFYMPPPFHELMVRPFIHHGGRYLAPVPDLLPAIQPRLEQLLNPENPRTANRDKNVWERYERIRAKYTEKKTLDLFHQVLPGATVHPNLKYEVEEDGVKKEVELDGLIVFDTSVLLVETKAGSVHKATRRGGPKKIQHDIGKLLVDSHAQAARAQRYIEACDYPLFKLPDGGTVALDKSAVRRIFRVGVTLDHMDAFTTALHRTAETGLFPDNSLPWAVGIRDFMVIAEMFEFPSQFMHYLTRRKRLNEIGRIYAHDELDWLGHYFTDGLYFEELASQENASLRLLSYSTQFDDYYFYKLGIRHTPAPKPGWRLPITLHRIIEELEATGATGYSEAVLILLDMSGEAHCQFVSFFDETRRRTRKDGRCHDASMTFGTKVGLTIFSSKCGSCDADFERLQKFVAWKRETLGTDSWLGLHTVVGEQRLIHGWVLL